jgi:hypothetical protein
MDGLELRERILAERPGTKVLLLSEHVRNEEIGGPFLQKLFHVDVLKRSIRQLLTSAASGSPAGQCRMLRDADPRTFARRTASRCVTAGARQGAADVCVRPFQSE